ncbi:MAG: hypothetical protein AAGA22_06180, partial [Pseudomonadota bacterium]
AGSMALATTASLAETPDAHRSAGGVAIADATDGITSAAYVLAPPNYSFVVEREAGSFIDCGGGQQIRSADQSGRLVEELSCSVSLTETVVIPAAAESARIIIHY